jgi:hypothetical protein
MSVVYSFRDSLTIDETILDRWGAQNPNLMPSAYGDTLVPGGVHCQLESLSSDFDYVIMADTLTTIQMWPANCYQVIGSGLQHRWPALNLSRTSGAGCSRSITVAPMRWPEPSTRWTAGMSDRSSVNAARETGSGRPAGRGARVSQ